ncbi:MAG: hypothetical protein U0132_17005 [Gemmatimonadaceae bacterium]
MKRIIALLTATVALVACSNPTSPDTGAKPDAAKAHSSLAHGAKTTTGRLSAN